MQDLSQVSLRRNVHGQASTCEAPFDSIPVQKVAYIDDKVARPGFNVDPCAVMADLQAWLAVRRQDCQHAPVRVSPCISATLRCCACPRSQQKRVSQKHIAIVTGEKRLTLSCDAPTRMRAHTRSCNQVLMEQLEESTCSPSQVWGRGSRPAMNLYGHNFLCQCLQARLLCFASF